MLTLLLGKDSFAKEQRIREELARRQAERVLYKEGDPLPDLRSLSGATLFGPEQVFVFQHCLGKLDHDLLLNVVPQSSATVFIIEDTLDKRKSANQELLKHSAVKVEDYPAPAGDEAVNWLIRHAQTLGLALTQSVARHLYRALCPDEEELPVLLANQELGKLATYADGSGVSEEIVDLLVVAHTNIDVFGLLDFIATKQKGKATRLLENYFALSTGDEKTRAIQLVAMLGDQLRNLLIVKDAEEQKLSESALMKLTGWKSGRIYVLKKLGSGMTTAKLRQTLNKLEKLDLELKTSGLPHHVVLDVIIAGM